jgi:beta-glucosidase
MTQPMPAFPDGFTWGASTAAYQIEGAAAEDGRGPSIWDTFSHEPGRIVDGGNGDVACDHYHRYVEDVALLADLGVGAYRFSISWPRVQPTGHGPANAKGLDFYDRLVDALQTAGIAPVATLFHWDLPQALQDKGGWATRDTAARFSEYADLVAERIGDRVKLWITLNEPVVHTSLGHVVGNHAPGVTDAANAFPVLHHQLLGHGLAAAALRRHGTAGVALANNYAPIWPLGPDATRESATDDDRAAAALYDLYHNRIFTDPVLLGAYPPGFEAFAAAPVDAIVLDGDLAVIGTPLDALGVNYYNPLGVSAPPPGEPFPFAMVQPAGFPLTGFGWPVVPDGLRELLTLLHERYPGALPPLWITENGCAYPDGDDPTDDRDRIAYLDGHIRAVDAARAQGVDIAAYCIWSLLDNFEWAEGYAQRFGLVHVDFETLRRTPRSSFAWYRDLIRGRLSAILDDQGADSAP